MRAFFFLLAAFDWCHPGVSDWPTSDRLWVQHSKKWLARFKSRPRGLPRLMDTGLSRPSDVALLRHGTFPSVSHLAN